ncbi:MAG: hypothetical protein ACI906_005039 [Candidatus Latescibacterota bacterium]|jgi:uncharacterized protein YndB with AHSA1/START domain
MKQIFHLIASLYTTPNEAFAYFTHNEHLESWLVEVAEVEPRAMGKYELFWQPDDRENNSTIGCKVTSITPNQLLAFDWKSPKQFKAFANSADPLTHVVVAFIQSGDSTDIHLVHSGWRDTPEWQEAREWQEKAWRVALDRLVQKVNKA